MVGRLLAPAARKVGSVFYGWRVVAVSFIFNAVNDGTWLFGFAVFFLPISRDLQISKTGFSFLVFTNRLTMTLIGPIVGYLIDRVGPGTLLFWSGLLAGFGFIALRWTTNYLTFALVMVGMLNLGMMPLIPGGTAAVARWFIARRSLALGVATEGWPVGAAVLPPLLTLGVATIGWRDTVTIIGVGIWLIVLPLSRVLRKYPHDMGLQPDGVPRQAAAPVAETPARHDQSGLTVGEGLRSVRLWLLSLSMGMHSVTITALSIHFVAIMVWRGLPETTAGFMIGVWAAFMAPVLLILGWLGDRWFKSKIISVGFFMRASGWFLFLTWMDGDLWKMVVVLLLLSPDFGVFSVMMALVADWVGLRNYATIRSVVFFLSGVLGMIGPLYAGIVFDRTDSYALFVWPSLALTVTAATILWLIPTGPIASRTPRPANSE